MWNIVGGGVWKVVGGVEYCRGGGGGVEGCGGCGIL